MMSASPLPVSLVRLVRKIGEGGVTACQGAGAHDAALGILIARVGSICICYLHAGCIVVGYATRGTAADIKNGKGAC